MTGIDADCIISVNNNPRAAIFAYSDYGVVSDAKKLLESMLKTGGRRERILIKNRKNMLCIRF